MRCIKWKIEATSIIILASFTLCFLMRMTTNALCVQPDSCDSVTHANERVVVGLKISTSFTDRLKWLVVYFCVLEMQEVRIKVESDTLAEYQKNMRRLKIFKILIVVVFVLVQFPIIFIPYFGENLLQSL